MDSESQKFHREKIGLNNFIYNFTELIIIIIIIVIIIIYHDFLPPPRRDSHAKSDTTHTIIKHTHLSPYTNNDCKKVILKNLFVLR